MTIEHSLTTAIGILEELLGDMSYSERLIFPTTVTKIMQSIEECNTALREYQESDEQWCEECGLVMKMDGSKYCKLCDEVM